MIPILYPSDNLDWKAHSGYGKLADIISCEVLEELNGEYSCTFEYPITGPLISQLYSGNATILVLAPIVYVGNLPQDIDVCLFDVYKWDLPVNGIVKFYANHVAWRMKDIVYHGGNLRTNNLEYVVSDTYRSPTGNVNGLKIVAQAGGTFTDLYLPMTTQSVLASIIGDEYSIVSGLGIDVAFTCRYTEPPATVEPSVYVSFLNHRGVDRGAKITHGVNMLDFEQTSDKAGTFNAYVPFWDDGNGNKTYVSGYVVQPTTPVSPIKAVPLDCSSVFNSQPTGAQMTTYARNLLDSNEPWKEVKAIRVSFVEQKMADSFVVNQSAPDIMLGDTVSVEWSDAGVEEKMRCVAYKYDVIAERYTELTVGKQQDQFVAVTGDSYAGANGGGGGSVIPDDVVRRIGNSTRFNGAINDIDITPYQTAGGYAFLLAVVDWVSFGDLAGLYLVHGIASGVYQGITQIFRGTYGPLSVAFNGTDKIRITFYNNAGGYYSIIPIMAGET